MKMFKIPKFTTQILTMLLAISLTNCSIQTGTHKTTTKTKKVPPGQAKKAAGAKSAKNYAPGHNK
jgi:hypothetical protein